MTIWLHEASKASGDAGTLCTLALDSPCITAAGIIILLIAGLGLLAWWAAS